MVSTEFKKNHPELYEYNAKNKRYKKKTSDQPVSVEEESTIPKFDLPQEKMVLEPVPVKKIKKNNNLVQLHEIIRESKSKGDQRFSSNKMSILMKEASKIYKNKNKA